MGGVEPQLSSTLDSGQLNVLTALHTINIEQEPDGGTYWTSGVLFPVVERDFSFLQRPERQWGPTSYHIGTGDLSLEIKRQGREADHSLHLVPKSRMMKLYLRSLTRLRGGGA
jgi:hypothetical protein